MLNHVMVGFQNAPTVAVDILPGSRRSPDSVLPVTVGLPEPYVT